MSNNLEPKKYGGFNEPVAVWDISAPEAESSRRAFINRILASTDIRPSTFQAESDDWTAQDSVGDTWLTDESAQSLSFSEDNELNSALGDTGIGGLR